MNSLSIISLMDILKDKNDILTLSLFRNKGKEIELPSEMAYLRPYLKKDLSPLSFFQNYKKFYKKDKLLNTLRSFGPDIIGITSFSVCYYRDIIEIAKIIKRYKNIPIIIGGPGPSAFPEIFAGIPEIDLIIKGNDSKKIKAVFNEYPDYRDITVFDAGFSSSWELVSNIDYSRYPVSIVMTRGCPKHCSFCSIADIAGRRLIKADPEQLKHILWNYEGEKLWLNFEDDNISFDRQYFEKILDIIIEIRSKIQVSLTFMNGIDYSTLDEDLIIKLKKAGVKYLNFTLASYDKISRYNISREQSVKQYETVLDWTKKYNIDSITYFIAQIPGNGMKTDRDTLRYLIQSDTLIGYSPYYPVSHEFKDIDPMLYRGSVMYPYNKEYSTRTLISFFKITRLFNLLKSKNKALIDENRSLIRKICDNNTFYYLQDDLLEYPSDKNLVSEFAPLIRSMIY